MSASGSEKSRLKPYNARFGGRVDTTFEITGATDAAEAAVIVNVSAFERPDGETTVTCLVPGLAPCPITTSAVTEIPVELIPLTVIPVDGLNSIAVTPARPVPLTVNAANVWFAREVAGFRLVIAGVEAGDPTAKGRSFEAGPELCVTQTLRLETVAVAAIWRSNTTEESDGRTFDTVIPEGGSNETPRTRLSPVPRIV